GECEEHAECDDLQHISAHHGLNHVRGENVHNGFDETLGMSLADCPQNVGVVGGESHASAGLCEIDDCQSDHECRCGNNLEIDQRLNSHAPHLAERTRACDSHHNG